MHEIQVSEKGRLILRPAQTNVRMEVVFLAHGNEKNREVMKFQYQELVDNNGYKDIAATDAEVCQAIEKAIRKHYNDAFGLALDVLQNDHGLPFEFRIENITFTGNELFIPEDLYFADDGRFKVVRVYHSYEDMLDDEDFDLVIELIAEYQPRTLGVSGTAYLVAFERQSQRVEYVSDANPDGWVAHELKPEDQFNVRALTDTYLHCLRNRIGEPFLDFRIPADRKVIVNAARLHYDFF